MPVFKFGLACALAAALFSWTARAADQPQWGERFSRNMVSAETNLPASFNLDTGENIRWTASLGGGCYGSPIVADGNVFIGANNSDPRDPRQQGDRGGLYCLDEKTGALRWQLLAPRIGGDDWLDWPEVGICSPPTVEGDRVYTLTNRSEVVCLDIDGMADGNDGPYQDEGRHAAPADQPPLEPGPTDADIIWLFDLRTGIGQYPHDAPHLSILLDGDVLYLNTCNGVDNTHKVVRCPDAPSLIALDKNTGRLLAADNEKIGHRLFHCTWCPPSLGEVNGQRLIFFGGPDGVCYAFKALSQQLPEQPQTLECVWRFDTDPAAPKENVQQYLQNTKEGPSEILGMPVFHNNRVYVTTGGDIWWGKSAAWIKCLDATKTGDVTATAEIWSCPLERNCCATPAIVNTLVFVTDGAGKLYCLDADTGEVYWNHDVGNTIWSSPLAADGKVYAAARNGAVAIFAAEKTKNLLFKTRLDDEINGTPTAANQTLFLPTLRHLYAIAAP